MNQTYCLNLHERYAPEWSAWECARELFANAKDAAADTMTVSSPDANTLEIWTPTVPDIAELFIIGCGSKSPDDTAIGQFGEGLKLTALASTRIPNGSLTVRLPNEMITFAIREHFGQQVLFADVIDSEPFEGCLCTLTMTGAGFALNGKIIEGEESHTIPKAPKAEVQIFCKGVWICSVNADQALFSYNLNDLPLNRDRSHANPSLIEASVGRLIIDKLTDTLADQLIAWPFSWEAVKGLYHAYYSCSVEKHQMLADAFIRKYGEKGVLHTDKAFAAEAESFGYKAVGLGQGLQMCLSGYVPSDVEVLGTARTLTEVAIKPDWTPRLAELDKLSVILDFPNVTVKIFADQARDLVGKAVWDDQIIWLNERLLHTDNRFLRVQTFIHELAHLQSRAGDATRVFENALDLFGGKLALRVLDSDNR